ncbi:MAG: hypothetical protein ACO1OB_07645 [Archangium sp.]
MKTFRILCVALLAMAGCTRQQPPTEVPPSPAIEFFTATPSRVAPGEAVTLSWKVANATGLELREATDGTLPVPADRFEGTLTVNPSRSALYVLTAVGEAGTDARAVAVTVNGSQSGVSFEALPPVVAGGDVTTLVWVAPGARTVSLSDGASVIPTGGQLGSGAVTLRPNVDTTYTLTVDDVPSTVDVTVQAAILAFTGAPMAVQPGQPITLSWESAGATRVELSGAGRGVLFESTDATQVLDGSFVDTAPALSEDGVLTYELVVEKGTQRMTRSLEVYVGTSLRITRLTAPEYAAAGGNYIIRWETVAAEQVEVRINGTLVFLNTNPSQAAVGQAALSTPSGDFGLEFIASNARGARDTRSVQVEVVGVPASATLSASPTTVSTGGAVTLTWSSGEARRARIYDNDGQPVFSVRGPMAESGSAVVYPGRDTTYRIVADNTLGAAPVSATASVTVTGAGLEVTQEPKLLVSGQTFTAISNDAQALLVGFPHQQVLRGTRADFLDIASTGQQLDITASPGVATVETGFETWLWGEKQPTAITVSRAGWFVFGGSAPADSSEATTLPSTGDPNGLIAPFFDNLTVTANSAISWQRVGEAPNERLIVQWDRMQVGTDTDTELTFQAQVHQNGSVSFQYKTMTLAAAYTSYRVGLQDGQTRRAVVSSLPVDTNSALYFFSPIAASAALQGVRNTSWGGFLQKNGVSTLVSKPAQVLSMPEDLAVTEAMFNPNAALPAGQYAELFNRTAAPIDLTGWYVTVPATGARFDFPAGFVLAPHVPVVVGQSLDPALNDDAGVTLSWADAGFSLPRDGGAVFMGTGDAGFNMVFVLDGGAGTANVVEPGIFRVGTTSTSRILSCSPTQTFGSQTPLQRGTPGAVSGCGFGYRSVRIASHFVDVSDGGTQVTFTTNATVDDFTEAITLASAPTDPQPVLFGQQVPVVSMSMDGWLAPYATTQVTFTNKTAPNTSNPRGVLAPFWDDLWTIPGRAGSDLFWKFIAANEDPARPEPHWIFQWNRLSHFQSPVADDLNFEVKLFEDGVVEYHYATMRSGSSHRHADGNSATVWLDKSDAGVALVESVNSADVQPFSAIRFIPQ